MFEFDKTKGAPNLLYDIKPLDFFVKRFSMNQFKTMKLRFWMELVITDVCFYYFSCVVRFSRKEWRKFYVNLKMIPFLAIWHSFTLTVIVSDTVTITAAQQWGINCIKLWHSCLRVAG